MSTEDNQSAMSKIYESVADTFTSLYSNENFDLLGQDKEILNIGNVLNSIFINRGDIDIPQLVVVGSQSSGKSSILNSILGMDILPTGSNMVTRGPLQLELIQTKKEIKACFGEYVESTWLNLNEIPIDFPNPSDEQKAEIRSMIKQLTNQYAGNDMNITDSPIYLRIYSPNIPNLSLVDLPGLTMVACTDKGQPKDIKERIRNLIGTYIKNKSSLIMAVMPARTDIEADIALDLIKEYDPRCERTVGILTKIDLMNEGTDITHLLENKVSKDLQLGHGYYAIKNRNKLEMERMTVIEGLKDEYRYFSEHPIYSNQRYKEFMGIPCLCKNLSGLLVKSLKKSFPRILEKINRDLESNSQALNKLGDPIPQEDSMKSAFVHKTIAKLTRSFISILEDRGKIINSGRNIKQQFVEFRNTIDELTPFASANCNDSYITDAISNCEGNHMSFPSPPVEVLEQLMKDPIRRPIFNINQHAQKCSQNIMNELNVLIEHILEDQSINRFPELNKLITKTCLNDVFIPHLNKTYRSVEDELSSQENYIWTDDLKFNEALVDSTSSNVEVMRILAENYFKATVYILQDTIPKKIMYSLVTQSQKEIGAKLYEIIKETDLKELLKEVDNIQERRNNLDTVINDLRSAKELIEGIM
jgi:GTP-binding protein EngB required for normal cell division